MTPATPVLEENVVTVTLPPADVRTTLAQRLSLRLALWLLLRTERSVPRRKAPPRTAPPPWYDAATSAPSRPCRDAALAHHTYSVFRHLR